MKKLKIPSHIDLKELKYLGFIKTTIVEGKTDDYGNWIDIEDVYCLLNTEPDISDRGVETYDVTCYINKNNELSFCAYSEQINWSEVLNLVYDLTKAGMLLKE